MLIISHNVDEPRNPDDQAEALWNATHRMEPNVYVLQECKGSRGAFIDQFGEDYRVLMSGAPGSTLITMVRRDHVIKNERYLHMTKRWVGPKLGIEQRPRIHQVTDLAGGWRIVNLHRVWCPHTGDRGGNGPAFVEEHQRLLALGQRKGSQRRTTVFFGDQNAETGDTREHSPRRLALALEADIISTGARVDWAFVMNGFGRGNRLGNAGSDHPIVTVRVGKAA